MRFVDQNWKELPATEKLYRVWDEEFQNLGCQVLPTGVKSWVVVFRVKSRKNQVYRTLGRCDTLSPTKARLRAKSVMANFTEVEEEGSGLTMREMLEDFYATYVLANAKPSYRDAQRWYLDKKILPEIGDTLINDVGIGEITVLLTDRIPGKVNSNRCAALLSKAYNWARRRPEYLDIPNPVLGHQRNKETPRADRLFDDGIRKLGKAWRASTDPLKDVCIWPLIVGCRKSAALKVGMGVLNEKNRTLTFGDVDDLKGCEVIYIPKCALEMTKKLPPETDLEGHKRAWRRLRKASGVSETTHDLRRTFESIGADIGQDANVMHMLTGHSLGKLMDTYLVLSGSTLQGAADKVGLHIWNLLHEDPKEEVQPGE